jgi:TetR/AcrR family transcriptional regulator
MIRINQRPGHPGSRQKRSVETRAAILAAAGRVFARSGIAGARTDAIAAAAGVNKALLYYYFKGKESLYEAVVEDHFSEFNRQALAVLTSPGPARAVLLRYVSLHFDFISARHRYASLHQQVMMAGGKLAERLVRKYFKPRSEAFGRLLERGMRHGEFRRADGFHSAMSVISLIVFYFSAAPVLQLMGRSDAYSAANLKRRKQEVLDFIRHGLFTDPDFPLP